MIGPIARFGSSRGMLRIPNLSGLTRPQALDAIRNSGLKFSESSTLTTTNQSLADKIESQSVPANTLVDYDSEISFVYFSYVPYVPTVTYGSCSVYSSTSSSACSGLTLVTTTTFFQRRQVFYDGSFAFNEECSSFSSSSSTQNSTACGYVAPVATCSASCGGWTSWSSCSGGSQSRTRTCTRTNCSTFTDTDTRTCCTPACGPWSSWSGSAGGQSRTRTCLRSDCTTYTETENRCTSYSSTSCGPCNTRLRRSCTTTTGFTDCTTSTSTFTQSC
jgi:hypothetical protein